MIQYLRASTFGVSDVFTRSWQVLRSRYFSILGLCLSLFFTSNASGILAFYLQEANPALSATMAFLFVILYFGIQLTLIKFVLTVIDHRDSRRLKDSIPRTRELARFFLAMFSVGLVILISYLFGSLLAWPFIYWVGIEHVLQVTYVVSVILTLYFLVRIAFYPFILIDQDVGAWQAIRRSLILTKRNVVRLLKILSFFGILHFLYIYFNYLGHPFVSTMLSVLNSFLVVPLSSVVIAVAYRDMVKEYVTNEEGKHPTR